MVLSRFTGFLLCLLTVSFATASDLQREQRLKNEIADYIVDGDAVMLDAGKRPFLSIYMESEVDSPKGAVILMHGRGLHPDWPAVIYPLRTGLPELGWHTLSIQMPVLDVDASFYEYLEIVPESFPRIEAAIKYLRQQGIDRIVLLAHSCSVHMAVAWLAQHPHQRLAGFIGIGMGSTDKGQPMREPLPLHRVQIPVLDIRGEYDYPAVHGRAAERWQYIQQAGKLQSRQRMVPAANHYFTDKGDILLKEVSLWLKQLD